MKRKLITLFAAFLVLAGFQVKAQVLAVDVVIQTGDSTARWDDRLGTHPAGYDNERGGYAAWISNTPNKLFFDASSTAGVKFFYRNGAPKTFDKADRITVSNPVANLISFSKGGTTLTLRSGTTDYTQFVVFRGGQTTGNFRVPDYYTTDNATNLGGVYSSQTAVVQPFNGGVFEGYLAIQLTTTVQGTGLVDAHDLLIVVHDQNGALSLITYQDYVDSLEPTSGTALGTFIRSKDAAKCYYPLYIKTEQLTGRWARPSDFADCNFNKFIFEGTVLKAQKGDFLQGLSTDATAYEVFTAKQVDFIVHNSTTNATNNIFTHTVAGAQFQGKDWDIAFPGKGQYYGTMPTTAYPNGVIPLFVLATPEDECKVLSVSRINKLEIQSQNDGGYGNEIEIRDYAQYYGWNSTTSRFESRTVTPGAHATPADVTYDTYTSLQKFAIWINEDGECVLYPAASYFWEYGETKLVSDVDIKILPNAVLFYNDINVRYTAGSTTPADKLNGIQIGWWNGRNSNPNIYPTGRIATSPNMPQTITDYTALPFSPVCWEEDKNIEGRFYFLEVLNPDTLDQWRRNSAFNDAFGYDGYQENGLRKYVLSSQVYDNIPGINGGKFLVMLPKETVRTDDPKYWRFPYDKVNMAAHWEVKAVRDITNSIIGYRFINMLGDTLKYDPDPTLNSALYGGYLGKNRLWAGANDGVNEGIKYFGRPEHVGLPWWDTTNWFDLNNLSPANPLAPATVGYDVWKVHQMKDQDFFFLELTGHGTGDKITLRFRNLLGDDWHNTDIFGAGADLIDAGNGFNYYQRIIGLDLEDITGLQSYASRDEFNACPGLQIAMKPIDYVPNHGTFYPNDRLAVNNTVDVDTVNTNYSKFMKQDSLTAYTFLEGNYAIMEALPVDHSLKFGYNTVLIYDGTSATVDAAALKLTQDKLQFIPLNSPTGAARKTAILDLHAPAGVPAAEPLSWLYDETYKWYLVKLGNKYLSFDFVNLSATTNREMVGLVFNEYLANAVPVRLYQPLVGDKAETNFLFQFYIPNFTYFPNATTAAARVRDNRIGSVTRPPFPEVESPTLGTPKATDEVCFASLSNHSDFIFATRAYTGLTSGTRFTIEVQDYSQDCLPEFIDPQWLANNRLLSLPLNNQIWVADNAVNAWFATGAAGIAASTPVAAGGTRAVVSNTADDPAITTLTHTYVTSIREYNRQILNTAGVLVNEPGYELGWAKVGIPTTPGVAPVGLPTYNSWIGGNINATTTSPKSFGVSFERDLEVPLYYVQNDEGLYLTVVPHTQMRDQFSTVPDVSGIRLEWKPLITWTNATFFNNNGYDPRVLQLFAISGCKEVKDGWYGKFIYLPLASFMADYTTGDIIQTASTTPVNDVFYNFDLGKGNGWGGNDVTNCWRISQWAPVEFPVKDFVVFNSKTGGNVGSLVPVEFKLSKQQYIKESCDYQLVQNMTFNSADYYTFDNTVSAADDYTISAHWEIKWDAADPEMATFIPELKKVYNETVGSSAIPITNLKGEYYFVKRIGTETIADDGFTTVRAIDVSGYASGNFTAKFDTLKLTCVDHAVPFFDLEADGGNVGLLEKMAILETPFVDRNLTYVVPADKDTPTPIYRGGNLIGYQTYINRIDNDISKAEFLTVYKENRRELTENHIIPYYAFSITNNGVEYFLNIDVAPAASTRQDSVYWTALSTADRDILLDWENNPSALKTYKFCLPYQVDENGVRKDLVKYGDTSYPPVYLQTLDIHETDYPYLVVAGSATNYVTARNLWDAIKLGYRPSTLSWNIYTVDYRFIDPNQVTAWIFGGSIPPGQMWVPIAGAINNGSAEGVLTNQALLGDIFLTQSGNSPVNYGVPTGISNAPTLKVEFEGDTLIGTYAMRPIWYYRINLNDTYLTDATGQVGASYYYTFYGTTYPYGFFGDKIDNFADYVAEGIKADENFVQAFGFKYVVDDTDPLQPFYVVSNANYKNKPAKVNEYRYLASINDQLVFVNDPLDALIFQWGHIDGDGKYVDLKVVGKSGIYGVEGGVKFLNTTGKVDIFSIDGRLIKSSVLTGGEQIIPAPRGIAVVKNGSTVVKVVVQ